MSEHVHNPSNKKSQLLCPKAILTAIKQEVKREQQLTSESLRLDDRQIRPSQNRGQFTEHKELMIRESYMSEHVQNSIKLKNRVFYVTKQYLQQNQI